MRQSFTLFISLLILFAANLMAQKVNIDSVKNEVVKGKQDTNQVINYRILAGVIGNSDPAQAIGYANKGVMLGKRIGFDKGVAGCYLNIAVAYNNLGKLDSALLYIDTAISWSVKAGEPGRLSLAYLNRADYKRQNGNMKGALLDCDTSMTYAEKANKDDTKARILQTIGSVYHTQDNYTQSGYYYEKAYKMYEKAKNTRMMAISQNNLGNVYKHQKEYDKAITGFQTAIKLAEEVNDAVTMSMYYSNMADVYNEVNDFPKAEQYAAKALAYAKEQENNDQVAESQSVLALAYLKMNKTEQAIRSGNEAYKYFSENGLIEESQTMADILGEAYHLSGNHFESYKFMKISRDLTDSSARQKYDSEVAQLQGNLKLTEKDKEIQLLAKDKELQKQKLGRQRLLFAGVGVLLLLSLVGIWLLVSRNKLKHRMKELELRNQIAADLHDEVGSSLSSINMLSQMATKPGNETLQKSILEKMSANAKETMEKMSDLVWTIKPEEAEGSNLKQRMERFAYEICGAKNIALTLQLDKLETKDLTMDQRKNMYLIFKEALNNAVKYSETEKIAVSAANGNNVLTMIVKDEGKGFDMGSIIKGNGLDNIQTRAASVGGKLSIDSAPGSGTTVKLTMPLTL